MKPIILSLFQIVTLNFTLFIFAILTCFLKTMSLKNRFVNVIFESKIIVFLYSSPSRGLYSSVRMEIEVTERCHNFRTLSLSLILYIDFPRFQKFETKNFNSDPCFFNLVKLGTISPAVHFLGCADLGRSQVIEEVICDILKFCRVNVS